MLRTVIGKENITEIYKVSEQLKRGSLVIKDLATKTAHAADGNDLNVFLLDFDAQPTGHLSDSEISQYSEEADVVKANTLAVLKKYPVGAQIATDQTEGDFAAGDIAVAKEGKFIKAADGATGTFRFVGDYLDGNQKLKQFEVIVPPVVAP